MIDPSEPREWRHQMTRFNGVLPKDWARNLHGAFSDPDPT